METVLKRTGLEHRDKWEVRERFSASEASAQNAARCSTMYALLRKQNFNTTLYKEARSDVNIRIYNVRHVQLFVVGDTRAGQLYLHIHI
jgi:hypothetical protein